MHIKHIFKRAYLLYFLQLIFLSCCLTACSAEKIVVDASDFEMLDLPAKSGVKATTTKKIQVFGRSFPKNTLVEIEETWLRRLKKYTSREKKSGIMGLSQKKGYKIRNYYKIDSTANRSFILPINSVEVFYLAHLQNNQKVKIVIPERLLLVSND